MNDRASEASRSSEIQISNADAQDEARNLLLAQAVKNTLAYGGLPESGRGTVAIENGIQRITGINDDKYMSNINWAQKVSRSISGQLPNLEIHDRASSIPEGTKDDGTVFEHDRVVNSTKFPRDTQDKMANVNNGKVDLEMKGICHEDADGSVCTYEATRNNAKGTVEITTKKVENPAIGTSISDSKMTIHTANGDSAVDFKFVVSRQNATYEYKNRPQ
jgi:hypothetical protein